MAADPHPSQLSGIVDDLNVGMRVLGVSDVEQGVELPVWIMYPTRAPAAALSVGAYEVDVAQDAPLAGRELPVVVISHGNNGSPWTHRGTAMHLARAGFVVVMVEHIGNSRSDASLAGTVARLVQRPRHIRLAIDAALADPGFGPSIAPERVAIIGHSIGAYTALAVAGGRPMTTPFDTPVGPTMAVPVTADARVRALVLLAPASGWYAHAGSLSGVSVPVLMYSGDRDAVTPAFHADIIVRGVERKARLRHVVVAGAGHHSFQSPFPAAMTSPAFAPSQDPNGFDRPAFHERLNREIAAFLLTEL